MCRAFLSAKYIIEKKEWETAMHPDERTSAVYIPERLHPLHEAGQVEFIEGSTRAVSRDTGRFSPVAIRWDTT